MIDNSKQTQPIEKEHKQECCMAARQTGKASLRDIIQHLHRRADDLQKLHDMLPEKPTKEQDEALWNVVGAFNLR